MNAQKATTDVIGTVLAFASFQAQHRAHIVAAAKQSFIGVTAIATIKLRSAEQGEHQGVSLLKIQIRRKI
jgi:hypothetical protein